MAEDLRLEVLGGLHIRRGGTPSDFGVLPLSVVDNSVPCSHRLTASTS